MITHVFAQVDITNIIGVATLVLLASLVVGVIAGKAIKLFGLSAGPLDETGRPIERRRRPNRTTNRRRRNDDKETT